MVGRTVASAASWFSGPGLRRDRVDHEDLGGFSETAQERDPWAKSDVVSRFLYSASRPHYLSQPGEEMKKTATKAVPNSAPRGT